MTEPTRGARARRGNRRPGSLLLTALLVLAIVSSSALVFTDEVALLKLAVVVALWAAVVGAFVSFIYRRQADLDRAKSRDLKLVYDLQLDREISARREYELSIETHLRRELASEMRAQTSDEVASLRAELAALRANLEIIFDTDLQSRPAIETERTTVHRFGDWDAAPQATQDRDDDRNFGPGRVISSRIDTQDAPADDAIVGDDSDPNTEESPIIDVPAEPQPEGDEWGPLLSGGAHRRASEQERAAAAWRPPAAEEPRPEGRRRAPEPVPPPSAPVREPVGRHEPVESGWRPAPAQGQFIPAGAPGSNWTSPVVEPDTSATSDAVDQVPPPPPVTPPPAMTPPPTEAPRPGRHYTGDYTVETAAESARRARHAAAAEDAEAARRTPPTLATPAPPQPEAPEVPPARHRGADEPEEPAGQHIGGQPVSELMARLQANGTGGGRRRRRDE